MNNTIGCLYRNIPLSMFINTYIGNKAYEEGFNYIGPNPYVINSPCYLAFQQGLDDYISSLEERYGRD